MTKIQISKTFTAWLMVINFAFFIFFLSSIPDLRSPLQPALDIILRKISHATEYVILTYFLFLALSNHRISKIKAAIFAFILAVLYATTDEYHQSFIPGREMALVDFLIDSTGALLSTYLIFLKNKKIRDIIVSS